MLRVAEWVMKVLGKEYGDSFANVASDLGVLLHSKEMDAESAAAMWEESNVALRGQRIILHHLAFCFGRRLTAPENFIQALELVGVLPPITGSVEIVKEAIRFW